MNTSCSFTSPVSLLIKRTFTFNGALKVTSRSLLSSTEYFRITSYNVCYTKLLRAATKGVVKTMAKMGISTIQSYRGAQIFEAVGLAPELGEKYFTRTASRIGGIGLDTVAEELLARHRITSYNVCYTKLLRAGCRKGSDEWGSHKCREK